MKRHWRIAAVVTGCVLANWSLGVLTCPMARFMSVTRAIEQADGPPPALARVLIGIAVAFRG